MTNPKIKGGKGMRNKKRLLSVLLCLSCVLSLFSGCGKEPVSSVDNKASENNTVKSETTEEHASEVSEELEYMEISVAQWDIDGKLGGDAVIDLIEEKFNVNFVDVSFSWSDYTTKAELWASTDSLPDMFTSDQRGNATF